MYAPSDEIPQKKEVNPVYDIEVYADQFEQKVAYRLECEAEQALENAVADAVLTDLEQATRDLLKRLDAHQRELEELQRKEIEMFTEWLS